MVKGTIIISFWIFIFSTLPTFAVTTSCNVAEGASCPAGCYTTSSSVCSLCKPGTYSSTPNSSTCLSCEKPSSATYKNISGMTTAYCPWRITCSANYYWNGSNCVKCASYHHSSAKIYEGVGNHPPAADPNVCEPDIYKITLKKNLSGYPEQTLYAWVKYGKGFALSENATSWSNDTKVPIPSSEWWQVFMGYYSSGNAQIFSGDGSIKVSSSSSYFKSDTTLYGKWRSANYKVEYRDNEDSSILFKEQNCTIGIDCKSSTSPIPNKDGLVFEEWLCSKGCSGTSLPGTNIPEPTEAKYTDKVESNQEPVILIPKYKKCPIGYYCQKDGKQNKCPKGTTTKTEGASKATDCCMRQGTYGTRFCDKNGCFTLPGSSYIPYQ